MRTFKQLKNQFVDKYKELQDIQSLMYGVQNFTHQKPDEQGFESYNFVCYFNSDTQEMGTTICDSSMTEIKLIGDVPVDVMCGYGAFCLAVLRWQEGEQDEFPCELGEDKQIAILDATEFKKQATVDTSSIEDEFSIR